MIQDHKVLESLDRNFRETSCLVRVYLARKFLASVILKVAAGARHGRGKPLPVSSRGDAGEWGFDTKRIFFRC